MRNLPGSTFELGHRPLGLAPPAAWLDMEPQPVVPVPRSSEARYSRTDSAANRIAEF